MNDSNIIPYSRANWYKAITGKPYSTRKTLSPERSAVVEEYANKLGWHMSSELHCTEFAQAFSAVLDMYEDYLDAIYDLDDHEIDELCYRCDIPRKGFDRYVEIAKLQKQAPTEIEVGQMLNKKWAFDPAIVGPYYAK